MESLSTTVPAMGAAASSEPMEPVTRGSGGSTWRPTLEGATDGAAGAAGMAATVVVRAGASMRLDCCTAGAEEPEMLR